VILHFTYRHVRCLFVRSAVDGRLLAIDAGWPGTLLDYARGMKEIGLQLREIAWAIVTHFHMDHAGLVTDLVERGVECWVFERQREAIAAMEATILKNDLSYRLIDQARLVDRTAAGSREALRRIGIDGEVIVTDYHSPDSVSFLSVEGEAAVGDLPPVGQAMPDDLRFHETWKLLRDRGARTILPSHAPPFVLGAGK
jgi:endoribonuclease LACTB2